MGPSIHLSKAKWALLTALVVISSSCRKKSGGTDDAADLAGEGTAVVVSGSQPANGTTIVISNGQVSVVALDNNGKILAEPPRSFEIRSPQFTSISAPRINWSASDKATSYEVAISPTADCKNPVSGAVGIAPLEWTVTPTLVQGNYYVCVTARNKFGTMLATNNALPLNVNLSVPVTEPAVALNDLDPYINSYNKNSFAVSGTCNFGTINVSAKDYATSVSTTVPCSGGTFATSLNVSALLEVTTTIEAKNDYISSTKGVIKDTIAPVVTSPTDDAITTKSKPWTWGCTTAGCAWRYLIDNTSLSEPTGAFGPVTSAVQATGNGTFYLHIQAKDLAGNISATTHSSAVIDTTAPVVSITSAPNTNNLSKTTFSLTGACNEVSGSINWNVDDQGIPGTAALTGTASCNGTIWNVAVIDISSLADGTLNVTADLTDTAGNAATPATTTFSKDTIAPLLTIVSMPTVNLTNKAAYAVSGTCSEASGTVNWSIDDVANGTTVAITGTATCDGSNWTKTGINVASLDEGTVNMTANLSDLAGNPALQANKSAIKNTTLPALNLNAPGYINNSNKNNFAISGTCDESGLAVLWSIDDQGNAGTAAVSSSATCDGTNWSASAINLSTLDDGTIDIVANMTSGRGSAPQESITTQKDVIAPTVSVSTAGWANAVNKTAYAFSGSCDVPSGTVAYSLDDQGTPGTAAISGTTGCNGTSWTAVNVNVSTLIDGTLDITANLNDVVGNSATPGTGTASKDTVIPTVAINAVSVITTSSQTNHPITGTCSENTRNVTILVDDGVTSTVAGSISCSSGNWTTNLNLSTLNEGLVSITANHTDAAGNNATQATTSVTHDSTAPSVPNTFVLNDPASNLANDTTPQLRFTALIANTRIRVYNDSGCSNELATAVSGATTLNVDIPALGADGIYTFYARSEDVNGNPSSCSTTAVTYTLDTNISSISNITLVTPASTPGKMPLPTLKVHGVSSNDTVKLYSGSSCFEAQKISSAPKATGTDINVTVNVALSEGSNTIYARSNDDAQNFSACSSMNFTYVLDTVAPTAPSGVVRTTPVSSPNNNISPTFTVSGVTSGFEVAIYTESSCTNQKGIGTASGSTITLGTGVLSTDGPYTIYATQKDLAGNRSVCSSASGTYTLDASAPVISNISISSAGGKAVAAKNGYAYLTFNASEPLNSTSVTIHGRAAAVTNPSGLTYVAQLQFTGADTAINTVPFSINCADILANPCNTVTAITQGVNLAFNSAQFAPVPSIANQIGAENSLLSFDINDGGDDFDADPQAITYPSCYYDQTVNGSVSTAFSCSALGATLNSATGMVNWTPSFTRAGIYEFRVTATDGTYDGDVIFTVTINNTNRDPVLKSIPDQNLSLASIFNFNMTEVAGSSSTDDIDIDGETVLYTCIYDTTIDGDVTVVNNCVDIDGADFDGLTGYFTWTVKPTTPGDFEFKVIGNDGNGGTGTSIFNARVSIDISKIPQLCMVGTNFVSEFVSLSDNNEVTIEDATGSPVYSATHNVGDLFTFTTNPGYRLNCTGGCFAITRTQGTAAWSTQSYSSTLLSTYWGRNKYARIVIAAFDQDANFSVNSTVAMNITGPTFVAKKTIVTVDVNQNSFSDTALWINSDAPIAAYISTENSVTGTFDQDGRVITAAAKEALGFVSGGGGTPAAITTTQNNTTVSVKQNGSTNPGTGAWGLQDLDADGLLDINERMIITDTARRQNPAETAIAIFADKPVVSTQHADGDGTNSTPSLPRSMLATHFIAPVNGDYISFAAFDDGDPTIPEIVVLDNFGNFVNRYPFVTPILRDTTAPYQGSPFGFTFPIGGQTTNINYAVGVPPPTPPITPGYRYVCSKPCMGIIEPINHDETLMTGTKYPAMTLTSTSFTDGGTIPADFTGNRAAECSGGNDFPNLTWENLPWGTKFIAIVAVDETASNFVHLNATDIAVNSASGSLDKIEGASSPTAITGALNGDNDFTDAKSGWTGPCNPGTTHTYRFKVYALAYSIGQVNGMDFTEFENDVAIKPLILGSASINGTVSP